MTKDAGRVHSLAVWFTIGEHILLNLICETQQHNTAVESAINSLRVIGCVLIVRSLELSEDERRAYAMHSFWSSVLQLSHLRGLVFGMAYDDAHEMFAEAHTELCQLSNRQIGFYRFISLENVAGDEHKWIARDPSSLDTTGMFISQRIQLAVGPMSNRIQTRLGNA